MEDASLIYVAAPLSQLSPDEAGTVTAWCNEVEVGILRGAQRSDLDLRAHLVTRGMPPWERADAYTAADVYRKNSAELWSRAAALVIVGYRGGSLGVGQELAWACAQALPILYIHDAGTYPSRQLVGTATEANLAVLAFETAQQISALAETFVWEQRDEIRAQPERRRVRREAALRLQEAAKTSQGGVDGSADDRLGELGSFTPGRLERLRTDPDALASASLAEVLMLIEALGGDPDGVGRALQSCLAGAGRSKGKVRPSDPTSGGATD